MTRESGVYKHWIEDVLNCHQDKLAKLIRKEKTLIVSYEQLSFTYVFDLFYSVLFFHLVSILILLVEFFYFCNFVLPFIKGSQGNQPYFALRATQTRRFVRASCVIDQGRIVATNSQQIRENIEFS